MRYVSCLGLLLLAACSKPAEEPVQVSAEAPPPVVVDPWPGKYWGDGLRVTISGTPGAHRVMLITGNDHCDGEIGMADKGAPAKDVSPAGMSAVVAAEPAAVCTITLRKTGDTVTVQEDAGCASFHGATCSFNGTVERVK